MSEAEIDWVRNRTPPGAWEQVADELKANPAGTEVELWWYGPRTAPNGPWMRDKCRRLGIDQIEIRHRIIDGQKTTFVSIPL